MKFLTGILFLLSLIFLSCDTRFIPYRSVVGPAGGTVYGPDKTILGIPENALTEQIECYVLPGDTAKDLPTGTLKVYEIGPLGLKLDKPAFFAVPKELCNPQKWSAEGKTPWIELTDSAKNCPQGYFCTSLEQFGYMACIR